jgi:hypothetical protein
MLRFMWVCGLFAFAAEAPIEEGPELPLSMMTATSIKGELPFVLFTGGKFQPDPAAEFVKVHMHLDRPSQVTRVEVDSCSTFRSHVLFYFNFDERLAWSDAAGEKTAWAETRDDAQFQPFKAGSMKVSSITMNFRDNHPLCLSEVRLYNGRKKFRVIVPKIVSGSAKASSTLSPSDSYDVMNLFDSRYEYAWSSNAKAEGVTLDFNFDEPQTITQLRIWNGYQRTSSHCYSNGRLKQAKLEGEGYSETFQVADEMGSQIIELKKPFKGKALRLTTLAGYAGKKYQDLVISELRFFNGSEWFLLSPLARAQEIARRNRTAFSVAGLEAMVNRNFRSHANDATGEASSATENWTFRFREDGSFYARGSKWSEDSGSGANYSALGNYEIKETGTGGIELRLFGSLRKVKLDEGDLDCNGCGRNCNSPGVEAKEGRIFQDFVKIEKTKDGRAKITNVSKGSAVLTFRPTQLEAFSGDEYSE